ncbi:hypothetical protein HanRHA438_Chr09g0394871 [Helianthus annuus]|nr:hypothetical protein HanRHA438_Chr09g0394871 [Helianthus annuus]
MWSPSASTPGGSPRATPHILNKHTILIFLLLNIFLSLKWDIMWLRELTE